MNRVSASLVAGLFLVGATFSGACFVGDDDFVAECTVDADCPASADPCVVNACFSGFCSERNNAGTAECECVGDEDCNRQNDTACMKTRCNVDHACVEELAPAGSAADQTDFDCNELFCDGTHALPSEMPDDTDVPPNQVGDCKEWVCSGGQINSVADAVDVPADPVCGKSQCNGADAVVVEDPDGTSCETSGICFNGGCLAGCTPANATACGDEGPNEPSNDVSSTASSFSSSTCGFLDASDYDWFTFYAKDREFRTNILHFSAWSSAPTIEMCAYVKCGDGTAPGGGGCASYVSGPNGSLGCCWTGASQGFTHSWDLDCGTIEDSGDVYVSMRSTTADTCETYAVTMSY